MNDKTKKERLNQLGNDIAWQSLVRWERTTCLPHMPFPSGAMHTGGAAVGLASALHGPPKFARTRPTFELFELYSPPARHESGLLAFVPSNAPRPPLDARFKRCLGRIDALLWRLRKGDAIERERPKQREEGRAIRAWLAATVGQVLPLPGAEGFVR
mgnify:CR=1 FL=1